MLYVFLDFTVRVGTEIYFTEPSYEKVLYELTHIFKGDFSPKYFALCKVMFTLPLEDLFGPSVSSSVRFDRNKSAAILIVKMMDTMMKPNGPHYKSMGSIV